MEKAKYEKPIIQRLGYDRTVMGVYCVGGGQAGVDNCPGGNRASLTCGGGNGVSAVCATGPSAAS